MKVAHRNRVIVAVILAVHAEHNPTIEKDFLITTGNALATAIRLLNHSLLGKASVGRHLKRIKNQ